MGVAHGTREMGSRQSHCSSVSSCLRTTTQDRSRSTTTPLRKALGRERPLQGGGGFVAGFPAVVEGMPDEFVDHPRIARNGNRDAGFLEALAILLALVA